MPAPDLTPAKILTAKDTPQPLLTAQGNAAVHTFVVKTTRPDPTIQLRAEGTGADFTAAWGQVVDGNALVQSATAIHVEASTDGLTWTHAASFNFSEWADFVYKRPPAYAMRYPADDAPVAVAYRPEIIQLHDLPPCLLRISATQDSLMSWYYQSTDGQTFGEQAAADGTILTTSTGEVPREHVAVYYNNPEAAADPTTCLISISAY